mmetsp:Transcript_5324/g.14303  ORF Transcript_5324/g.14303 Transcript_5324/m.14303 type:complete len:81 (+) Transcript_5324:1008-1250(+)
MQTTPILWRPEEDEDVGPAAECLYSLAGSKGLEQLLLGLAGLHGHKSPACLEWKAGGREAVTVAPRLQVCVPLSAWENEW